MQGPENKDPITQDFLWLKDSFIQEGKAWDILMYLSEFQLLADRTLGVFTPAGNSWVPSAYSELLSWLLFAGAVIQRGL